MRNNLYFKLRIFAVTLLFISIKLLLYTIAFYDIYLSFQNPADIVGVVLAIEFLLFIAIVLTSDEFDDNGVLAYSLPLSNIVYVFCMIILYIYFKTIILFKK